MNSNKIYKFTSLLLQSLFTAVLTVVFMFYLVEPILELITFCNVLGLCQGLKFMFFFGFPALHVVSLPMAFRMPFTLELWNIFWLGMVTYFAVAAISGSWIPIAIGMVVFTIVIYVQWNKLDENESGKEPKQTNSEKLNQVLVIKEDATEKPSQINQQ